MKPKLLPDIIRLILIYAIQRRHDVPRIALVSRRWKGILDDILKTKKSMMVLGKVIVTLFKRDSIHGVMFYDSSNIRCTGILKYRYSGMSQESGEKALNKYQCSVWTITSFRLQHKKWHLFSDNRAALGTWESLDYDILFFLTLDKVKKLEFIRSDDRYDHIPINHPISKIISANKRDRTSRGFISLEVASRMIEDPKYRNKLLAHK